MEKQNNKGIIICMIFMMIIMLGVIGYLVWDKISDDEKTTDTPTENKQNDNSNNQNNNQNEVSEKINYENYVPAGQTLVKTVEENVTLNGKEHKLSFIYSQEKKYVTENDFNSGDYICYDCNALSIYLTVLFDGKTTKLNKVFYNQYNEEFYNSAVLNPDLKTIKDLSTGKEYLALKYLTPLQLDYDVQNVNVIILDDTGSDLYSSYVSNGWDATITSTDEQLPYIEIKNNTIYVLGHDSYPYCENVYKNEITIRNGKIETNKSYIKEKISYAGGC